MCISDADLLRVLWQAKTSEAGEDEVLSFPLLPKRSRGKLGIRVALRGKKLFVHVVKGENLPNADPHSLSDPYCDVSNLVMLHSISDRSGFFLMLSV